MDEKLDEKHDHHTEIAAKEVDTAAQLLAGITENLDPKEADRVRWDAYPPAYAT